MAGSLRHAVGLGRGRSDTVRDRMTARRALPLAAVAALAIGGCDYGTAADLTPEQERARVELLEDHADWTDHELARLCPGLYPRDFLTNEDDYPKPRGEEDRRPPRIDAKDRAQANAAACDVRP
jgi:hypothetical protein